MPVSPKWRQAIEQRIENERLLTMRAIEKGARLDPGRFWTIPGAFLFTIYVMTALGFGAPIPHTLSGRTSALIYAAFAVPAHLYLMLNASLCLIVNVKSFMEKVRKNIKGAPLAVDRTARNSNKELNSRSNSDIKKSKGFDIRKKLFCLLSVIWMGRCVPLAVVMYYTCGALAFGVLRSKQSLEVVMFPLEFTTSGGLEYVEGYVRILYGFYVEGAMSLLACTLMTLRRHSSATISSTSAKYRLYTSDKYNDEYTTNQK